MRVRSRLAVAVPALAAVLAAAGCSAAHDVGASAHHATAATSAPAAQHATSATPQAVAAVPPATITTTPATGAKGVDPAAPISVAISHGTLTAVTVTNPAGKKVAGALAAGNGTWTSSEDLGYGRTYTITATGTDTQGRPVTQHGTFSTVAPDNQVDVSLDRMGGYGLADGATYGVGIVPVVHFDEPITGAAARAAAVRALTVTTSPHIDGAWAWYGSQDVHYRPQTYWPSGTKVTVTAKVYGKQLGDGLYGAADQSTSFTIGRSQVTIARDNAPNSPDTVTVYRGSTVVRSFHTSMGMHSGEYANGQYIDFHTMNGTYTVLEHDNPAIMSSASYGLPANAPGGYAPEPIYYSTKISTDGIYLHYLDTTYAQEHGEDVSHGCLNLNHDNAVWFYDNSLVGDPVQISGTHGPTIDVAQGGDWSVAWSTWLKGSITND